MAEVINLRQARKSKARAAKDAVAEENRVRFGQTKAEKMARRLEAQRQKTIHDGLLLQRADEEPKGEE